MSQSTATGAALMFVEAFERLGETYITGDGNGVALWEPPGTVAVAEEDVEEFGARMEAIIGPDAAARMFEIMELFDAHHPEGTYWHLQLLGVDPVAQGRGLGSALLADVLARCDREGTAAYLEATSPDNKRLYERHGFTSLGTIAPEGGPTLWRMYREPAAR